MMFCPKCGEAIADDSAFCPKCGEKIKTTDSEPAVVYASQKEAAPAASEKSKSQGMNIFLIWGILPILSLIFLKLSYYGTGFASSLLGDKVLYTTGYEMITFDFEMFSYDFVMGFVSIINAFLIVLCVVNIITAIIGYTGKAKRDTQCGRKTVGDARSAYVLLYDSQERGQGREGRREEGETLGASHEQEVQNADPVPDAVCYGAEPVCDDKSVREDGRT